MPHCKPQSIQHTRTVWCYSSAKTSANVHSENLKWTWLQIFPSPSPTPTVSSPSSAKMDLRTDSSTTSLTRRMPLPNVQKSLTIHSFLYTQYERSMTDGQAEGMGKTILRSACSACWRAIRMQNLTESKRGGEPINFENIRVAHVFQTAQQPFVCKWRSLRHKTAWNQR